MELRSISLSGLGIALTGFILTRFTVTLAADESTIQFLFAGVVPLTLGLSLAAFGVILTVGSYERTFVRTTALWCLLGAGTMAILVVLTVLGAQPDLMSSAEIRQQTYLSNFLIGGAVGGTLTGLYAARNQRHRRDMRRQANRLIVLNRLLRDKVINAATAIKGHSAVLREQHTQGSVETVDQQAQNIIDIVENVKYLSETADQSEVSVGAVDVVECIKKELAWAEETYPDAAFDCEGMDQSVSVRANAQLSEVFRQLLSNAVEYNSAETPRVRVTVESSSQDVIVRIVDEGSGLPTDQQALLERGEIAEFDDPTTGFGLNIVRLLVESFDGRIETAVGDEGSTITVRLPRAGEDTLATPQSSSLAGGVDPSRIALAVASGLVAGATMGVTMVLSGGNIPVIGALYGVKDPLVALISHEFHSVVFALFYAGLLSVGSRSHTGGLRNRVGIGLLVGFLLWLFAAGVIMPLWLQLVGIEAALPNLTVPSLLGHIAWGLTLGVLYEYGDRWLSTTEFVDDFGV